MASGSSKKSAQRRKEKRKLVKAVIFLILVHFVLLIFAVFTATHILINSNIASDNLCHYSGEYELFISRYPRRSRSEYLFVLENGDRVTVKPELMRNFESSAPPSKLSFAYSQNKDLLRSSHTCVVLKDAGTVYLTADASQQESRGCIILGGVMFGLTATALTLYVLASRPKQRK